MNLRTFSLKSKMAIAVLCLTLTGAVGGLASADSAEAASGVSYCFRDSWGGPYQQGVLLQVYSSSGWTSIAAGGPNYNGCGSFTMSGSYRYLRSRAVAVHIEYSSMGGAAIRGWHGVTPYWAPAGSGSYSLGTGLVKCLWGPSPCA